MSYYVDRNFQAYKVEAAKINPASVDLSICTYRRMKKEWVDVIGDPKSGRKLWESYGRPNIFNPDHRDFFWNNERNLESDKAIILMPLEAALFGACEFTEVPGVCLGLLFATSTFGRALVEHLHAGLIDPGFNGNLTFEIINLAPWPVELYFEQRVVQMILLIGYMEPHTLYQGRYQNQEGAVPPRTEVKTSEVSYINRGKVG